MAPILGIDLGTTNSLCAVFEDGRPTLIPNVHGQALTPSVVGVQDSGEVLVGAAAVEMRVTRPERCAWCFKRWMGTDRKARLGRMEFSAPELSSMVLASLKRDAEVRLGQDVRDAVITVPAYFNDHQRKATKLAGELAGLDVRRIVNEPTAAALAYGFHDRGASKQLIVLDLGGGTFDVTTMDVFEGSLEIVSTAGESFLGGEDFTDRLVAWALQSRFLQLETAEHKRPLLVSRLRQECERAKRELWQQPTAVVRMPDDAGQITERSERLTVSRENFKVLVEPLLERLASPVAKAVRDAGWRQEQVNEVIVAGGATRMGCIHEFVLAFFGQAPVCRINPDEVVALGAAVQAALVADDQGVDDLVMTDVCPFTLGIDSGKKFGNEIVEGYFIPVIHRNTTIPVSRETLVYTIYPYQQAITIRVFQGEARKVEGNLFLGEFDVKGIPATATPQEVYIRFTYDIDGILEAEAIVAATGARSSLVIAQHAKGMSPKNIEAAVRRMQKIKFYPRDDMRNRRLVLLGERAVGEASPFQRMELEAALDAFEQSLRGGDREHFAAARQALLIVLSSLGFSIDDEETDDGPAGG